MCRQGAVLISVSLVLRPALWTLDHASSITCRYLPGFYTATKLYCLVTGDRGLWVQTTCQELYKAVLGRVSNPRPVDHKSPTPYRCATMLPAFLHCLYIITCTIGWWRGTVVERRSLAGELSLSCARPAADG